MKTVTSERCNVHTLYHLVKDFTSKIRTGWPLVFEFLDLLELFLDFFCTCKILEKGSFGHNVLEMFLIFFLAAVDFYLYLSFLHLC